MHQRARHRPHHSLPPATGTSWLVLAAALLLCAAATATDTIHILRNLDLAPGLTGEVADDASLVLREEATGRPLVAARLEVTAGRGGPRAAAPPFVGRTADGAASGRRGFAANADDDDDGTVDEDRLDGRDNDGDGLVDEDYAAIGDAMIVVDRTDGTHAEFYHWSQRNLRTTVFAAFTASPAGRSSWRFETLGSAWVEAAVDAQRHRAAGRIDEMTIHAFVTRMDAGADAHGRWVGVMILDEPADDGVGRTILDGGVLQVRLGRRPVALAVCAADSWLGLVRRLTEARVVREGVTDPVNGRRAPWIAVPGCATCRTAEAPPFRWRLEDSGHLVLLTEVAPGTCARLDPDLFGLDGHQLGAPDQIVWSPHEGTETGIAWSTITPDLISRTGEAPAGPYLALEGLVRRDAAGTLSFRYRSPHPALVRRLTHGETPDELSVVLLDGRLVSARLEIDFSTVDPVRSALDWARSQPGTDPAAVEQPQFRLDRTPLTLAPELLEGWPNPFRETINLRFRIPATVGEAFHWKNPDDQPLSLDLQAAVPWTRGEPAVSVKVYSINGEELATLHEGSASSGETTVRWNGTDAFGRKVASGAYFCKLQLDDWSVTRRIVFVR